MLSSVSLLLLVILTHCLDASRNSVCAARADAVFRLVLQPLCTGEWDLVCAHCPGADFVGRVAGAKKSTVLSDNVFRLKFFVIWV